MADYWVESGWSAFELRIDLAAARLGPLIQPASTCVYKREEVPRFDNQGLTYALSRIGTTPVTASSGI